MTTIMIIKLEDLVYDLQTMGIKKVPDGIIRRWERDAINIEDNLPKKESKKPKLGNDKQ